MGVFVAVVVVVVVVVIKTCGIWRLLAIMGCSQRRGRVGRLWKAAFARVTPNCIGKQPALGRVCGLLPGPTSVAA